MKYFASFLAIMFFSGLFVPHSFALAQTTNSDEINQLNQQIVAKQEKVKELERTIEVYKKKADQKRLESVSLSNQMAILDNRTLQVKTDIEATVVKVDTLDLQVQTLELEIEDAEREIYSQKEIIATFLRDIHQRGGKNFVEILATYDSFSDFYNQLQSLRIIEKDVVQSARVLQVAKGALDEKKSSATARIASLAVLQESLVERQLDLDDQASYKEALLASTQASELQFKTLVNNLKSQYREIESEISNIEKQVRARLDAEDKLNGRVDGDPRKLSWPTGSRYITARFHDPEYPYRHIFEHNAVDIRGAQGTPIRAAAAGYIARAKRCSSASCYAYVMIVHSGGLSTVYAHLSSITVNADQFVTRGDIIGYSGGTPGTVGAGPFVTGPHLHFEVRRNGIPVNPLNYLVKDWE
jgi:murein DD-endopeptidase MepM/ murein hydrolase activator NlpD